MLKRTVSLLVAAIFVLNSANLGYGIAEKPKIYPKITATTLRQKSTSSGLEGALAGLTMEMLQAKYAQTGAGGLKAFLADKALGKKATPSEKNEFLNLVWIVNKESRPYILYSPVDAPGWRVDLSKDIIQKEDFTSPEERETFISGSQLTWIAGKYTPAELIDAQDATKRYLQEAGKDRRIFTADNLEAQVAEYLPSDKEGQRSVLERLRPAFSFHHEAVRSIGARDIEFMRREELGGLSLVLLEQAAGSNIVNQDLEKYVRQAIVLDEENNPSFYTKGRIGTSKYLAVTASSGGFKYEGYSYKKSDENPPRSIYTPLAMIESYMEIAKTDQDALDAYKFKILHEYLEVSGDSKHRQELKEVVDLINKYDALALKMWKQRETAKAEERSTEKKPAQKTLARKYASWQEFEEKEIAGEVLSTRLQHLSQPQRIAFNLDAFPNDDNISLLGGINRIFDSIFRLLEGNPNFSPVAIFLDDYNQGTPASFKGLAEFLNSNSALGNAKYKVKLEGNNLIINGRKIALYQGLAKAEQLQKLGVDFLIEATRQRYLDKKWDTKDKNWRQQKKQEKQQEEELQAERIKDYLEKTKALKVIVVASEEDKGEALGEIPVVERVNAKDILNLDSRKIVLAEPVTAVTAKIMKIVENTSKKDNPQAEVKLVEVQATRNRRTGDQDDIKPQKGMEPALALNRVVSGKDIDFNSRVVDNMPSSGANAIDVTLEINNAVGINAEILNEAMLEARRNGLVDFSPEDTASNRETFNQYPIIFKRIEPKDILPNNEDGSSKRVTLRGFYSEFGYAKTILDLMTEISIFAGNSATPKQKLSLKAPAGTIPATPDPFIPQGINDGEAIPVGINSVIGRISIGLSRALWFNPNFEIAVYNGVRPPEEIVAKFIEDDEVYGKAPFNVRVSGKNFIFTDKEERIIVATPDKLTSWEEEEEFIQTLPTPYGNLVVRQNKENISEIRLHGETVSQMKIVDNQDGSFTAEGNLKSGTRVRLTYKKEEGKYAELIFAGVKKQVIIPFTNVRTEKYAYKQAKGESDAEFYQRVEADNREFTREILMQAPQLANKRLLFLEASGGLTEEIKLAPFPVGLGLISAPAKAKVGKKGADITLLPGVNTEELLQVWGSLDTATCASCTTNAAATGIKALLSGSRKLEILSGFLNAVHAATRTQGAQLGADLDKAKRSFGRGVDARKNIVHESTGAYTEVGKAIPELSGVLSAISLRVGNDVGSILFYNLKIKLREGEKMPTAEEINQQVKELTELPENKGGLKGMLGYGEYASSREIIGVELGGVFDPSLTKVSNDTQTLSIGVWYDNERGYLNQFLNLALLGALHHEAVDRDIEIAAPNVVAEKGAYTGRVSLSTAQENGATSIITGSGQFRTWEEEANRTRTEKLDVDRQINATLKEALAAEIKLPILNIYISNFAVRQRRTEDSINRQIAEGLKDIPPEDLIKIVIALEMEDDNNWNPQELENYLMLVRKAVSGYFANSFADKIGKEKSAILGMTVAEKIRVVLKEHDEKKVSPWKIKGEIYTTRGLDGIIFSTSDEVRIAINARKINAYIAHNPDRRNDLNKRYVPRFLFGAILGGGFSAVKNLDEYVSSLSEQINPYNIQPLLAPVMPQISELSAMQKGEKFPEWHLPPAKKVPVRVLLQNATIRIGKEGFVDLEYAATHLGIHDVLFGHSEVIELTGITDREIAALAKEAQRLKKEGKITGNIIVAVGETGTDYKVGSSSIVTQQVLNRLENLSAEEIADTVIAYEPRWAIGPGAAAAEPTVIQDIHSHIRNAIESRWGSEAGQKVRIIYGGNVKPENAEEILELDDVDGALIGSASTDAQTFGKIVSIAQKLADKKNADKKFYRKMYIAGNHKAMALKSTYPEMVREVSNIDRRKVEVALGPELANIHKLSRVYTSDPLEGIVFIDQLFDEELYGKVVHLRVDFNMPIDYAKAVPKSPDTYKITSDLRMRREFPTIDFARKKGAVVAISTHFQPKGPNLRGPESTHFMIDYVEKLWNLPKGTIKYVQDALGPERQEAFAKAKPGDIIWFDNTRLKYAALEKAKDPKVRDTFAKKWFAGRNIEKPEEDVILVNDAFGAAHRSHATIIGKTGAPRTGGMLLREELEIVGKAVRNINAPVGVILGGGPKIVDKAEVLKNMIQNILPEGSKIFIYGAAFIPFLQAKDPAFNAGISTNLKRDLKLTEEEIEKLTEVARSVIDLAESEGIEIVLPDDFVVAEKLPINETQRVIIRTTASRYDVSLSEGIYDIGPKTLVKLRGLMIDKDGKSRFGSIFKNGPVGVSEHEQFRQGNQFVFDLLAEVTKSEKNPEGAQTIILGADTAYAAELANAVDRVSYVSTGGGASLNILKGAILPGVEALKYEAGRFSYHLHPKIEERFNEIREIVANYAAEKTPAHTRPKEEYRRIIANIEVDGEPLAEDTQARLADFLFDLPSIWNIITYGGKLTRSFNETIAQIYKILNMDGPFFVEEERHEGIELTLRKAIEAGQITGAEINSVVRSLLYEFDPEKYIQFKETFAEQYGFNFEENLEHSLLHLVSEKLDGGFWFGGLFEKIYQVIKENIPYISEIEPMVATEMILSHKDDRLLGNRENAARVLSRFPELLDPNKKVTYQRNRPLPKPEPANLFVSQSQGLSHQLSDAALTVAKDTDNKKVILIHSNLLRSEPSLILALQSSNRQINQRFNLLDNDENNEEINAYRFVLVVDEPNLKTVEDVDKLFAEITVATGDKIKANKGIFDRIITQADMLEGDISHPADILKQLDRVGTPRDSIIALLGAKEWVERFKQEEGISKDTLSIILPKAKEGEITFAGNALFAAVEAVAAENKTLTEQMLSQLEMKQEGTTIEAVPKGIVTAVADTIKFYRERISKL